MNSHIIKDIERGSYFTGKFYTTSTLYDRLSLFATFQWQAEKYSYSRVYAPVKKLSARTGRNLKVKQLGTRR